MGDVPQMPEQGKASAGRLPHGFTTLEFDDVSAPVILPQGTDLPAALRVCINGWRFGQTARTGSAPDRAACVLQLDPQGGFSYHAPDLPDPMQGLTLTGAVCAAIADLSVAYCAEMVGGIGLHCGAVAFGDRLVVITGQRRAGKSTLIARLSMETDLPVFCDDVLPVNDRGEGIALGIAPRLRLPLPDHISPAFLAHAARHSVLADSRYAYLRTPNLAPHGLRARLGAIILLRRGPAGTPARLHRMDRAEALATLIAQSLTDQPSVETALARADALTRQAAALTLVYSDLEQAVALLRQAFGGADFMPASLPIADPLPPDGPETLPKVPPVPAHLRLAPARDVACREEPDGAFLWRPGDVVLWRLNPVAHAAWALLDGKTSAGQMADSLAEVFPGTPRRVILSDLCAVLGQFLAEGFAETTA
jgi:hypothetical protein